MLTLAAAAALVSGGLCGTLGYYIQRFKITTLSFSVAHAALAGAATALVAGTDPTYTALATAVVFALTIGLLSPKIPHERELLSLGFFSLFNALAVLMIYLSNVYVLSSASISVVLWGSLLAVTKPKLVVLTGTPVLFTAYLALYRKQIDAILFDKKLAEAEGINVNLHTLTLLLFSGTAIALALKLTGGFLVFTLLYNPVATSTKISKNARKQQILSTTIGALTALTGLAISYLLDLPVGASIALTSTTLLLTAHTAKTITEKTQLTKLKTTPSQQTTK